MSHIENLLNLADGYERWEMDNPKLDINRQDLLYLVQEYRDIDMVADRVSMNMTARLASIIKRAEAYKEWLAGESIPVQDDQKEIVYLVEVIKLMVTIRVSMLAIDMEERND